ncbi:hypothetical protein TIFTF001_027526 [Ficus carica]|uniref:Uncharacterized protein n=1 Tax=Ficus carica TaxID=3494 RepID=A0AA88IVA0_FICCA|nr:hypothetical protein TIFTF001_027526 [Ficus carica]
MPEYRVYLDNIRIKQLSRLMGSARRTSLSVKVTSGARGWKGERRETSHSLAIFERPPRLPYRGRKETETQPPLPCTDKEFHTILNQWIQGGVFVHHRTKECQVLRKIFHAKINNGTLKRPTKKQTIDLDPLSGHKAKKLVPWKR